MMIMVMMVMMVGINYDAGYGNDHDGRTSTSPKINKNIKQTKQQQQRKAQNGKERKAKNGKEHQRILKRRNDQENKRTREQ